MKKKTRNIIWITLTVLALAAMASYVAFSRKKLKTIIGGYSVGDRMSTMYSFVEIDGIRYYYSETNGWLSDMDGVTGEYKLAAPEINIEKFTFQYDGSTKDYILIK